MKCIIAALAEKECRPRAKWWGYLKDGRRYLMRYHHCLAIFTADEVVRAVFETRTDKAGVLCALRLWEEKKVSFE